MLLARSAILLCFYFFFIAIAKNVLTNPLLNAKIKPMLALAIPTGAPITVANDAMDTPLLAV